MTHLTESEVEESALAWLQEVGWSVAHGAILAPGELLAERSDFGQVVLEGRLREALARLNPDLPADALDDAFRKLLRPEGSVLEAQNRAFHRMLVDGVNVEYVVPTPSPRPGGHPSPSGRGEGGEGSRRWGFVRAVDFDDVGANDWLAVNQFSVVENKHSRRPDVVLFVNGLPLGVLELKNAADEGATTWAAFKQLQTYKAEIPSLFVFSELLVISDGLEARVGSLTAGREWFKPWRTITGEGLADSRLPELQVVIAGLLAPRRFLDLVRDFVVFEEGAGAAGGGALAKKLAGYHQMHAVLAAVEETLRATAMLTGERPEPAGTYLTQAMPGGRPGDRRVGVVWHTQGSGKSLTMAFYAGRIIREPDMGNPTIVVLTDRNDLDDQLFGTFSRCHELLRQPPIQAASREHLRQVLSVESGGVVFTTIQKFMPPEPSPRPSATPLPVGEGEGSTHYRGGFEFSGLVGVARRLRKEGTGAEEFLWSLLRDRQLCDAKFRRQHQFGPYVLDFYCAAANLAVECDGPVHESEERRALDKKRDSYLQSQGVTVLRFPNDEVLHQTEKVLNTIAPHLPSPPGRGAGGEGAALSHRRNIVVIADEAHRSQYDFIDGFARHMRDALPNASFIGFTGTPIELQDANTRAVFGDYISVYDIQRAVDDGATVPIYYESRLAQLALDETEKPSIDPDFEEATEGEEVERKERLKSKWAQLEAIVGAGKRLQLVAEDIVEHFERRLEALEGKGMVVCMSRRICVELYERIAALRPGWADDDDGRGALKVVMTGSASDPVEWQRHIRSKPRREELALRFRDAADPFKLVLVRDMWLTGFDAPSLHTMYLDKPMRGHGLMQAIARVNRVFRDKPGGLVVDYLGLAHELKRALATYTESGGSGRTALDQEEAVAVMLEKHEVCSAMMHGFDFSMWARGGPQERLGMIPGAMEHVLAQENGKERFVRAVRELSQGFALAVPHREAMRIRDDVHFFQTVQAGLAKRAPNDPRPEEELDHAVRQIVSRAVAPEGVLDLFAAAGLDKPDLSILSDEFLAEVRGMPRRNLAVELLQKLLKGEIRTRGRRNVVQARSFADMLEQTLQRYRNRAIEAAQVLEELIELAKHMREADRRGEDLGLTEDELAFYDALETNDSAVAILGDETLRGIARELVEAVRKNTTIDWAIRENVRAKLRVIVKRILRKYGYPPDKQEKATQTVLEQAEVLSEGWVAD